MNVCVYPSQADDEDRFLSAVQRSRELFAGWVNPPSNSEAFALFLNKYTADNNRGFLAKASDGGIVGCINLNEIVCGTFQSAYLGYYAFAPYGAKGLMKEAMRIVISIAFTELRLHRLEANIQPENVTSVGLVKSLGFRLEGYSPRYLNIGGVWRDHERHALTIEDWTACPSASLPGYPC